MTSLLLAFCLLIIVSELMHLKESWGTLSKIKYKGVGVYRACLGNFFDYRYGVYIGLGSGWGRGDLGWNHCISCGKAIKVGPHSRLLGNDTVDPGSA